MKRLTLFVGLLCICFSLHAQWRWYDPAKAEQYVIQNQGWSNEIGKTYTRLPERSQKEVPESVWGLSRNSAGLAIHFYSNAPEIKVRYTVNGSLSMNHMPATGVSGLDMYAINSDGIWNFCAGNYAFKDTITYHYNHIRKNNYHDYGYEYRLYLPLYNSVTWMEIGVPDGSSFEFIPVSLERPIVVYGTSIAQGGCASRPAMAWTSIVERKVGFPLINLGFSGSGKMEDEVISYVNELDARLYILDCLPNLSGYDNQEIYTRILKAVRTIRKNHKAPILLVEHTGCSNMETDSTKKSVIENINEVSLAAFQALQREGIKDLYYLYNDEIKLPADGWVDYVHPNDLGMQAQADVLEKKIREILRIPKGNVTTMIPVTQRREPYQYEWQKRHSDVLALNKSNPPKAVILGNSITHFWGGEPEGPHRNGVESWKEYMEPAGFRNQGCGWDRIENVLWRVYHDELAGFEAEKIVLMIGTNNMGLNSDQNIVEGIRFLLKAIKERQPKASIQVIGILPRRNNELWVNNINKGIETMVEEEGLIFCNAGNALLDTNGKIDETLFSDGLHPNEKGYNLIGLFIAE